MEHLERLKNLMIMAAIDRKLTDEELELLERYARRWNIGGDEYSAALEYASDEEAVFTLPEAHGERLRMLGDLVRVMVADGVLAEVEKQLFAVAAAHMGVTDAELNEVFDSL